ncbi:MAG: formylglycine-generating enzyme family protein [Lentisphaerae bacterium]|nr:formylglycine-generating enzyme family protein [Lentisphaerota bacterium]
MSGKKAIYGILGLLCVALAVLFGWLWLPRHKAAPPTPPAAVKAKPVERAPVEVKPLGVFTVDLGEGPALSGVEGVKMEFVLIPAGEFMMGSSDGEADEKPVHTVRIAKDFWMSRTEVTQEQWKRVMGYNPSHFVAAEVTNNPVEEVSWNDCQAFIEKLNALIASSGFAGLRRDDGNRNVAFRLPSEAEWEYACRAGATTSFNTGGDEGDLASSGWCGINSESMPHPVGRKQANSWGLFDMHGNVWEWCQDWQGPYSGAEAADPVGPTGGVYRVMRGGGWNNTAELCRSANRDSYEPGKHWNGLGFRLVCP